MKLHDLDNYLKEIEPESYEFERMAAIYWFAVDYHNGQNSDLYRISTQIDYKPAFERNYRQLDRVERKMYKELIREFTDDSPEITFTDTETDYINMVLAQAQHINNLMEITLNSRKYAEIPEVDQYIEDKIQSLIDREMEDLSKTLKGMN